MKRFLDKIDKKSNFLGCWEWTASLRSGYGVFSYKGKLISAHRFSWTIYKGEIPKGLFICHKCDNRRCVNPDHLFLGTHSDNMKDAYKKARIVVPKNLAHRMQPGHIPKNRLLSDKKAKEVQELIKNRKNKTLKTIAHELDIPYNTIRDISCGRIYKNIQK